MFTFKSPVVDVKDFIHAFAKEMGANIINNRFQVPSSIGVGYVQIVDLPNLLSAFIMNFTLHTNMHYEQSKTNEERYSLRFEESQVLHSMTTQIDGEYLKDSRSSHDSVYLVCSFVDLGFFSLKERI